MGVELIYMIIEYYSFIGYHIENITNIIKFISYILSIIYLVLHKIRNLEHYIDQPKNVNSPLKVPALWFVVKGNDAKNTLPTLLVKYLQLMINDYFMLDCILSRIERHTTKHRHKR